MLGLRTAGFRMGTYRGKQLDEKDTREYKIQRDLYLIGNIRLVFSNERFMTVRMVGYEFPLYHISRGRSCDLIGYDRDFNIYLFEVKKWNNREGLKRAVEELDDYSKAFKEISKYVEEEFHKVFFIKANFKKIIKIVLAPKEYYDKQEQNKEYLKSYNGDVRFGYFARVPSGETVNLVRRPKNDSCIRIHFKK